MVEGSAFKPENRSRGSSLSGSRRVGESFFAFPTAVLTLHASIR
jgi:hypothetical protein